MQNRLRKITILTLALVITMVVVLSFEASASYVNEDAKLLRVEYQGVELSKDRNNPTLLKWTGNDIILSLIGNTACAKLNDANDVHINASFNNHDPGCSTTIFNANGISHYYMNNSQSIFHGQDVFEIYFTIAGVIERSGDFATLAPIPNSESPKYYITVGNNEINHVVPQGDVPAIARAELNNVELSKDKNNPTPIPFHNRIQLVGNSACASKETVVQIWHNGYWTWGGVVLYFNSYALSSCNISVAYELPGNNGRPLYNETVALEFAIHNDGDEIAATKSPTYYVVYLDEESSLVDFSVNGLFHTVKLTGDQLIVEVKQGYIFQGSDMILKDITEYKEYELGIWIGNRNCSGVLTNRIVYSNLPLKMGNIYELTIPKGAVYYMAGTEPNDINSLKFNKEYKTELIMEGSLTFSDVKDDNWAYPYINELTEKRVINGYEDGTFKPNDQVTRNEFAKLMTLLLQIPLIDSATQTFTDVDRSSWAFGYVETVRSYMTGYYDGSAYYFKGSAPAVREDMAVALVKAMGLEDQDVDLSELAAIFSDSESISQNLRKYVLIAYKNKLIDGYPDGTFGAQRAITRAETTALLSKVYKSDAMEKVTFDDYQHD